MKKSALIFLLALFALPVLAQKTGFSGVVAEKKSGAPVEYATVLVEATGQWAVTDAQGRFTIQAVSAPKSPVSNRLRTAQMEIIRKWMDVDPSIRRKYSDSFFSLSNVPDMNVWPHRE